MLWSVPIWFVSWGELEEAVADDHLTLDELRTLPSLRIGSANSYREVLHPTDGADVPELTITANGTFDDGTPFQLRHHGSEEAGIDTRIQIGLRPSLPMNRGWCIPSGRIQ